MLTALKLKIACQRFQSRLLWGAATNRTMFGEPPEKLLDELSKYCSSGSKEVALEALKCLRVLIESLDKENWKRNEICYSLVAPLQTKQFHPLYRDAQVGEMKLSLMWLVLHKIQFVTYFEGPQHVLEVFVKLCQSLLSRSGDISSDIQNLTLKLLHSLFCKEVKIDSKSSTFPQLTSDILQPEEIFCRLVAPLAEIFSHWGKIGNKTDLLHIWNHFLDHCERCHKFVPVVVWRKIFKFVDSICADENETFQNKMAALHKCVASSKPVVSDSKFVDCGSVATTPAEALLKLTVELCASGVDESITFEMASRCKEICRILCCEMVRAFGYESCIYVLTKIEDFDSKSLMWAVWCGIVECFAERFSPVDLNALDRTEMRLFRRLRSTAVNFDLDLRLLTPETVAMIKGHLRYLGVERICWDCCLCGAFGEKERLLEATPTDAACEVMEISESGERESCRKEKEEEESFGKVGFGCSVVRTADLRSQSVVALRGAASKWHADSEDLTWLRRKCFRTKLSFRHGFWFPKCSPTREKAVGFSVRERRRRRSLFVPSLRLPAAGEWRGDGERWETRDLDRVLFDRVTTMQRKLTTDDGEKDAEFHVSLWDGFRSLIASDIESLPTLFADDAVRTARGMLVCLRKTAEADELCRVDDASEEVARGDGNLEKAFEAAVVVVVEGREMLEQGRAACSRWARVPDEVLEGGSDGESGVSSICKNPEEPRKEIDSEGDVTRREERGDDADDEVSAREVKESPPGRRWTRSCDVASESLPRGAGREPEKKRRRTFGRSSVIGEKDGMRRTRSSGKENKMKQKSSRGQSVESEGEKTRVGSRKSRKSDPCIVEKGVARERESPESRLRKRPLRRPKQFDDNFKLFSIAKTPRSSGKRPPTENLEPPHGNEEFDSTPAPRGGEAEDAQAPTSAGARRREESEKAQAAPGEDAHARTSSESDTAEEVNVKVEEEEEEEAQGCCRESANVEIKTEAIPPSSDEHVKCQGLKRKSAEPVSESSVKKLKANDELREESSVATPETDEVKPEPKAEDAVPGAKVLCQCSPTVKREDEAEKCQSWAETPKSVALSRGSRMLALIAESPKMDDFRESTPSPKQQQQQQQRPKIPPRVSNNSRASRMLALLPEFQDADGEAPEAGNDRQEQMSEGLHHKAAVAWKSVLVVQSPRTPSVQRKSIRFDEDRNRTLVFYSDSPPCQTVAEGLILSGQY